MIPLKLRREGIVEARAEERTVARMAGPWWLFLITGIAWLIVSITVLRADLGSVAAVAVLIGFLFIFAGLNEFMVAGLVRGWKTPHRVRHPVHPWPVCSRSSDTGRRS